MYSTIFSMKEEKRSTIFPIHQKSLKIPEKNHLALKNLVHFFKLVKCPSSWIHFIAFQARIHLKFFCLNSKISNVAFSLIKKKGLSG